MDGQSRTLLRQARGRRSLFLYLTVIGGLSLSLVAFVQLYRWERQAAAHEFESRFQLAAQEFFGAMGRELSSDLQLLRALAALYEASEQVTRQEFHAFATKLLDANRTIQALEWIPKVSLTERPDYEEAARSAIPGFQITERREDGALIYALPRDEYYPVYFVEPYAGNESATGFDLGSDWVRWEFLQRARDTGQMAVSAPLRLVQETGEQYAFLACLPVYRAGAPSRTVAQRRSSLQGFVLGVWRSGDLVERALSQVSSDAIQIRVVDTTDPANEHPLYPSPAFAPRPSPPDAIALHARYALEFGGRQWTTEASPKSERYPYPPVYSAWLVLLAGMTITALVFRYLRALQDHAQELSRTNRSLDREIRVRRHAETALKASEARLRQVLESAGDVILICDDQGRILIANSQTERLFGYTRDEIIGQPVEQLLPSALRERHVAHRADYLANRNQRAMGGGLELLAQTKNGSLVPVEISLSPVQLDDERIVTAIVRDISARKAAEAELRRLNRTHAVLSRCTRSLAGATDEEDLLQAYCQNLVDVGGYCFAWVGYAQEHKGLRRMAQAGEAAGDPTLTAATWSGTAERPRPSELPISTGAPIVLRHLGADSSCVQSPGTTAGPSCRSMISLPLKGPDGTFGSFSIYSADDNAFNETEVALLEELAQDVSLGIETMRARVAHEQQVLLLREEIEQEERKRIAATVHDGVGQSMQAVNLGLKRLRALADDDHQLARSLLDRIIQDVGGVIADLRGISRDLRPLFLERMELRQAMQYHCSELQEQTGIIVHFTYSQHSFLLDERVKRQCFLCFREALNNAVTHAKARRIDVILEAPTPDSLIIRVADDGVGFDPNQASKRPYGLGLAMIAERAASIGGKATIQSTPDGGTTVTISLCVSGTPPMGRRESDRRYPSSQVGAG